MYHWLSHAKAFLHPRHVDFRSSYSQRGEDIIIEDIFRMLNVERPTYLNIGANHPVHFNNTYKFYRKGARGILLEANPELAKRIRAVRPHDTCLNVGIAGVKSGEQKFYIFDNDALSTFSREQADNLCRDNQFKLLRTEIVAVTPINSILDKYPEAKGANFVSLDCEGLDIEILSALNFSTFSPELLCVETVGCLNSSDMCIRRAVNSILQEHKYMPIADTYLNTIFVRQDAMERLHMTALAY